jgi:hypothetical protein
MSAVLPIIASLFPDRLKLPISCPCLYGSAVFYALQRLSVFPKATMLCPILLRAGARFHKRTMRGR